jgi:hypothetical protein
MHSFHELNKLGTSVKNYIRNLLQKLNKLGTSIRNYFKSWTNQEPPSWITSGAEQIKNLHLEENLGGSFQHPSQKN